MKWNENLKCTYAFILHSFLMIKGLPIISVLYPFGPWMNFQNYTWDSLPFKIISHLTMVCYHQNPIRRTLGLTNTLMIHCYSYNLFFLAILEALVEGFILPPIVTIDNLELDLRFFFFFYFQDDSFRCTFKTVCWGIFRFTFKTLRYTLSYLGTFFFYHLRSLSTFPITLGHLAPFWSF